MWAIGSTNTTPGFSCTSANAVSSKAHRVEIWGSCRKPNEELAIFICRGVGDHHHVVKPPLINHFHSARLVGGGTIWKLQKILGMEWKPDRQIGGSP